MILCARLPRVRNMCLRVIVALTRYGEQLMNSEIVIISADQVKMPGTYSSRDVLLIPHDVPPAFRTGGGRRVGVFGVFHGGGSRLSGLVALRFLPCRNLGRALWAFHRMDLPRISILSWMSST